MDELGDSVGDVLVSCAELLEPGGLLTLSTAYGSATDATENAPLPEEELIEALDGFGLTVVEHQDRVPWIQRDYDRSFAVKFMHVVAATKR